MPRRVRRPSSLQSTGSAPPPPAAPVAATPIEETAAIAAKVRGPVRDLSSSAEECSRQLMAQPLDAIAESYTAASDLLRAIKGMQKEVEGSFRPIISAQNEVLKTTRDTMNKHLAPLKAAESSIKNALGDVARRQQEIEAERRAALAAKVEESTDDPLEAALSRVDAPAPEAPKAEGVSVAKVWNFEIVDPSRLKKVYMKPSESAIRALVRSLGPGAADEVSEDPSKPAIAVRQDHIVRASAS